MSRNNINQIKDEIYFEKLSVILTNIQQWEKEKNAKMNEVYGESVFNLFARLQRNGKQLTNQMNEFLRMMNLQYAFLSKLKKDERNVEISPAYKEFKQFGDLFGIIKESLLELGQYIGKMMGVTNFQFTELKRIYDEVDQIKMRYEAHRAKLNNQFNQKKQLIYSKKNVKKTFQLNRMIDIIGDLAKEKTYYNELSSRLNGIFQKQIESRHKMFKDICDNIDFISKLYEKSFQKDLLSNIMFYFKHKLSVINSQQRMYLQQSKLDKEKVDRTFVEIQQKFFQYFHEFLNEITITSWHIIYSKKEKQDDRELKESETNLLLTFDNKLIFYPENQKSLTLQINLEDIKIYKPDPDGKFEVKNRKNKERFYIKFEKVDNEDEFLLHYQQIANSA